MIVCPRAITGREIRLPHYDAGPGRDDIVLGILNHFISHSDGFAIGGIGYSMAQGTAALELTILRIYNYL